MYITLKLKYINKVEILLKFKIKGAWYKNKLPQGYFSSKMSIKGKLSSLEYSELARNKAMKTRATRVNAIF
jgi:hypothetical protein